jgi:hypothetical protein
MLFIKPMVMVVLERSWHSEGGSPPTDFVHGRKSKLDGFDIKHTGIVSSREKSV